MRGRTGTIRAAAEGVLVWLSRHPHTNQWLGELPRERAEPLVLRCRSVWHNAQLGESGGSWAIHPMELRKRADEETGLCVSDGT